MSRFGLMRGGALAQLLVAVSLAGVVGGVAASWHDSSRRCAERDAARALVAAATEAVLEWQERHPGSGCPPALAEALPGAGGPLPRDPWGEPLVYHCPGVAGLDDFDVSSMGPDRRAGTTDDIVGWE
jgi:hypothetical protein